MNKRPILLALLALLALTLVSGCDSMPSWMGGRKEEKPKLPGERVAALPVDIGLLPDATAKLAPVKLPPVYANPEWPQSGGFLKAAQGNLAGSAFSTSTESDVGEGSDFEHMLLPKPVIGGGSVFAMDAAGHISAHDITDIRKQRWHGKGVADEDDTQSLGGGLAYDQGRVYAVSGRGVVAAYDATTGQELWHKALRLPFISPPRVDGGKLYVVTLDNQLYAINAVNGDVLWNHRGISETAGIMNSISPVLSGGTLIVPYSSGELYGLSAAEGREIWTTSLTTGARTQATGTFADIGGDPVIDGDVLYAVSSGGSLVAFYLPNGQRLWERPIASLNTPWLAGDDLYVLTTDQTVVSVLKKNGNIRWATRLPAYENPEEKKKPIAWRGPVMVDGKLAVISATGKMMMLSATDGQILVTQDIPGDINTPPVVAQGTMFLLGKNATLYALH